MNDGCTGFFDSIANLNYRVCCDIHDTHLMSTRSLWEFIDANIEFFHCIAKWDAFLAIIMGIAVFSPIGVLLFIFGPKKEGV
jgi:hypothetical protein